MTKAEFYAGFKTLFADGKQPTLADALTLMESIAKDYDERDTLITAAGVTKNQIDELTKENTNLKQTNYKLFMSVGDDLLASRNGNQSTSSISPANVTNPGATSSSPTGDLTEFLDIKEPGDDEINNLLSLYTKGLTYQSSISAPLAEDDTTPEQEELQNVV